MPTNIYIPDKYARLGIKIWGEMLRDLIRSRELIWRLFVRDFLAKYKQTVLGVTWAVAMPLLMVATFIFLNRAGVLNVGETEVAYPVFALLGLTIWQLFASGLVACTNSILEGGPMVVKINFPKEALVIAALAQSIFELMIRLLVLAAVFAVYHVVPSWAALLFPLALIPLMALTLGLGFLFSLLNVFTRDISYMVMFLTTFLLFLTPVLYTPSADGFLALLANYNPLAALVEGPRELVIFGYMKQPMHFLAASLFSFAVYLLSWRVFYLAESRIAERV